MCWRLPPVALSSSNRTIAALGFSNYVTCWAINRDPISRKEIQKKKGKEESQPRAYRAEVKGIEGVVGKEGILRVLERSLIETERWSRSSSETKIVPLVAR